MRFRRRKFGLCYPGYRWCGPGCSGPGHPVNAVDACCKGHDECYRRYGRSKYCDQWLLRCLYPKINPYTKMGRDARVIYNIMKLYSAFK